MWLERIDLTLRANMSCERNGMRPHECTDIYDSVPNIDKVEEEV